MLLAIIFLIGGILFLYWGAHQLLRSSIQIALIIGMSPLVIGLTLVALATALPETFTSIIAQIQGVSGDVALGNVLGSNIANIGLVLGLALLICPVHIPNKIKIIEMPLLMIFSLILTALMVKGFIGRWEGGGIFLFACGYLFFEWVYGHNGNSVNKDRKSLGKASLFFILSIAALTLGAKGLVQGGVGLAKALHFPERVIAVSIIAVGTSLPELVTVILAATRKKDAFILGNIVGSNLLNMLFIIGLSALIRPLVFTSALLFYDVPIMIGFTGILWISMWKQAVLSRFTGLFYLFLYLAYLLFIFLL